MKAKGFIIEKCLPDHHIFFKPANTKNDLNGRPKNGMFVAVPICLKESVQDVSPLSSRIQRILIETQNDKIMLLNTYFPTDPRSNDFDETDLLLTLSGVKEVIDNHDFDRLVWTGDINAEFRRNTKFVRLINEFICELDISKSWDILEIDFTHACEVNGITHASTIDHFFWNSSANDSVIDAGVLHLPDNLSDHSPVFCILNSDMVVKHSSQANPAKTNTHPSWKLASDSRNLGFYNELQSRLQRHDVTSCVTAYTNVHCKNEEHKHEIDSMMSIH